MTLTLTPMQEAAGAAIRQQKNVQLLSPTGSGKTLAYVLPTMERIVEDLDSLQAVIIVPSRELAVQVEEVWQKHSKAFRTISLYGGRPAMEEHRRIRDIKPQVAIATPGRLLDHLGKGNISTAGVKVVVVDEYDKCLELGFRDEINQIGIAFSRTPQVILTSATPFVSNTVDVFSDDKKEEEDIYLLRNRRYEVIDFLGNEHQLAQRLETIELHSPTKDKLQTLAQLLSSQTGESTIVFVSHRESVERVHSFLQQNGFSSTAYHGGMDQELRERSLYRFRAGAANILVSTDLAARGLDIPETRSVIHYHLPHDAAAFKHRTGRTARWESEGRVFVIFGPEENIPDYMTFDRSIDVSNESIKPSTPQWSVLYIGRGKKDKLSKADILGFLCKKGGLSAKQIGRIDIATHASYAAVERRSLKSLLSLVAHEKIKGMKTIIQEMRR